MTEIVIVDDNSAATYSVELALRDVTNYKIAFKAINGYDMLLKLKNMKSTPSIAIVDIRLPNIDGVTLTQLLQIYHSEIKVIGISYHHNFGAYSAMIEAGAKGFLCKANLHHLKEAIETILAGEIYMDPDIRNEWDEFQKKNTYSESENEYNFTKQEKEHFVINATGLDYNILSKTLNLSTHCLNKRQKKITEKTGLSSRVAQTMLAIQLGIVKVFRL